MTGVLNKNSNPSEEEINQIPPYIFAKWLSGSPQTISTANLLNLYTDIPINTQYDLVHHMYAGKTRYIKYIKSPKNDIKDHEYIARELRIALDDVPEYLKFMSQEQYNEIIKKYKELEEQGIQIW